MSSESDSIFLNSVFKLSKKSISIFVILILVFSGFIGIFSFYPNTINVAAAGTTYYVGGTGGGNYTKIQDAIDNASTGDMVYVYSGSYNESLIINKSIKLVGQSMNTTIIDGKGGLGGWSNSTQGNYPGSDNGNGSVVYITASDVEISGFTVKNGNKSSWSAGIELLDVDDCKIFSNNISDNMNTGILATHCYNLTVQQNLVSHNSWYGIYFYGTKNSTIMNNQIIENNVEVYASKHNEIIENDIIGPSKYEDLNGVNIFYVSEDNMIAYNEIIDWSGHGVNIHYSNKNNISNNNIENNGDNNYTHNEFCGVSIVYSHHNMIFQNTIEDNNSIGISAFRASKNILQYNLIQNNLIGITISSNEVWNLIYLNEFINNTKNVGGISSYNVWNSTKPLSYLYNGENYTSYLGNYWDDYSGKDSDSNGVGDYSYNLSTTPTNKDYYPLMGLIDNYTLIPSKTKVVLNETCSSSYTKNVTLLIHIGRFNATISGVLNGTISVNEFEIVQINSSFFAGYGFFRSVYRAVIEGKVYEGHWFGVIFNKTGERKYYMKGTVFGDLRGIADGYLVETTNGSGIYNLYNGTWTLGKLGHDLVYVQLNVNGSIVYSKKKMETTQIYVLQASFKGNATGYYNKSIGVVLTHIRIINKTSHYYGHGFSIISYNCAWGTGSGWTYDRATEIANITKLIGFFTEPLWGLVFGKLDETGSTRVLYLTIERIDTGSPPRAILIIDVWGPWRASPGQTINYFIEIKNIGLKTAVNAEIVLVLPDNTTYKSHTGDGVYNKTNHEIIWRRNISAKSRCVFSVKVKVKWGLSWGTKLKCKGFVWDYVKNRTIVTDTFITRITPARDPNVKYGPDGDVTAGQMLNYKIEFENEGAGIAYGVYFTDELSNYLDDSTLKIGPVFSTLDGSEIAPPGVYNPSTRVITWFVGEVGPGAGGYAKLDVSVVEDAIPGTEIINYGTVYFPSVPEITRTNGIVSIVRANQNPIAVAKSHLVVKTYQTVLFNGSGSYDPDPDGSIVNYTWSFGDGGVGYGKIVSHAFVDNGDYAVTLTVEDNIGTFGSKTIYIHVQNRPPEPFLKVESKDIKTNKVVFDASDSTDIDGTVSEFNLDFGDGTNTGWVNEPIISHVYVDSTRTYLVKLRVLDDDGAISRNAAELDFAVNYQPKPLLEISLDEAFTFTNIECSGAQSTDRDGSVASYYFDFGDGTNSGWITNSKITHQYVDGTKKYTISLKVQDDHGTISDEISTADILIKNRKPIANLRIENTEVFVFDDVEFDASGSSDLDGEQIEFFFDFGDGTNSGWIIENKVTHIYTVGPRYYPVVLKVRDSDSEIVTIKRSINVDNHAPIADAGTDHEVKINEIIEFYSTDSSDPDGSAITYRWDFGDGTGTNWIDTKSTTHSYTASGTYTVTLTVSDGVLISKDTCFVRVHAKDPSDSDEDGIPDDSDDFPDDAAASVDTDGDNYPDFWNTGMSKDDSTTNLDLDKYPDNPDKHSVDEHSVGLSENIYLMVIIIISVIILIIIILTSIIRKNKARRRMVQKPYDSEEILRTVRDEVIHGYGEEDGSSSSDAVIAPGTSKSETNYDLWSQLDQKYKSGEISKETYNSIKRERSTFESNYPDK